MRVGVRVRVRVGEGVRGESWGEVWGEGCSPVPAGMFLSTLTTSLRVHGMDRLMCIR